MTKGLLCLTAAAAVSLSACGGDDPVSDEPSDIVGNVGDADIETLPPDESAAPSEDLAAGAAIPAALQGRWGMSPEDCTSTRGDAKGLLTISADRLRFYESVARPSGDVERTANSLSGDFDFVGEGQQWTRHEAIELRDGKLIRTESTPMKSYTYVRCG